MRPGSPTAPITLEGIGKTDAELEYAVEQTAAGTPLRWLAIESPEEADRLGELARWHRLDQDGRPPLDVLLRVNPDVAPRLVRSSLSDPAPASSAWTPRRSATLVRDGLRGPGIRLRGVHVHTGSDLRDVSAWAEAGASAVSLAAQLRHGRHGRHGRRGWRLPRFRSRAHLGRPSSSRRSTTGSTAAPDAPAPSCHRARALPGR